MKRALVVCVALLISTVAFSQIQVARPFLIKKGKVATIAGSLFDVKTESGDSVKASSKNLGEVNVGQLAWVDADSITLVDFPIEMERRNRVGNGDWMETEVKLSNTGILRGKTRTWTTACQDGFTGGVRVILMSKEGNDLYITRLRKYGVNGTCVPSAPSSRTELWDDNVPLDAVNQTAKVAIVHIKSPTDRVDEFLAKAKEVAEIAKTFTEAYGNAAGAGGAQRTGGQ